MNFFGHALVAAHKEADPRFVLGSMLPDLASMLRVGVPRVADSRLREGVAFHHETDRAFHGSESFRRLNLEASEQLTRLGVRRGTMRAVAHIGVELFIDAELATLFEPHVPTYQSALFEGRALGTAIRWGAEGDGQRFSRLCVNLGNVGVANFAAGVKGLVKRLRRALEGRPRLCIWEEDLTRVECWAETEAGRIAARLPALLDELSGALGVVFPRAQIR